MVDVALIVRNILVPTAITLTSFWLANQLKRENVRDIALATVIAIGLTTIFTPIVQAVGTQQVQVSSPIVEVA